MPGDAQSDYDARIRPHTAKQRHTAKRIFERLRDEHGYDGGLTVVKDYVRIARGRLRETFVPLAHLPSHAQVDFGEAIGVIGGVRQKIRFFYRPGFAPTLTEKLSVAPELFSEGKRCRDARAATLAPIATLSMSMRCWRSASMSTRPQFVSGSFTSLLPGPVHHAP
jgi:hypothetical protein